MEWKNELKKNSFFDKTFKEQLENVYTCKNNPFNL